MLRTNLIKLKRNTLALNIVKYSSNIAVETRQEQPKYPPILDLSRSAARRREKQSWHDEIQNVKSVEEKLIKINMPKYYGFKSVLINHEKVPYNALPLIQHYTRTHFIEQNEPLSFYSQYEEKTTKYLELIKGQIEESLSFVHKAIKSNVKSGELSASEIEDKVAEMVIENINRIIINNLAKDEDHLFEAGIDQKSRIEAYWVVGGVLPPASTRKAKKGLKWLEHEADDYVDKHVQYLATPALTIRGACPLESFVPHESATKDVYSIPHYMYDPRTLGYVQEHRHATSIPGFWPGDEQEFGLLSYHTRGSMLNRLNAGEKDHQEALHSMGILHSYAWLLAQSNYQGFNTYNDITYPLTTQTIITNGQLFSLYTYQLNTTLVHSDNYCSNEKVNLCWGTKEMKLFDSVDDSGKVVNLNDNVLRQLIQYYLNKPKARDIEMKPYLDKCQPLVANIQDEEKRVWLESRYKHLVSNRPRHRLPYEVYHWEKIYKIDHKTRPMEPRRRPFELGINPYNRRLDEHTPEYIPKCIRPGGPKSKPKWAKTYYP